MAKFKNIIIFAAIGVTLVLVYFFFIKKDPAQDNLVVSPVSAFPGAVSTTPTGSEPVGQDFLTLLLSVKNIKLNDSIFSDPAFTTLHDSSIVLVQDGNEGRVNPFAPIGSDYVAAPIVVPTIPTGGTTN